MRASLIRLALCVVILCSLVVAVGAISWPQSQQAADTRGPTLVTVDFRVLAKDGKPIRDLRPEEVTLKIGRRPRDVVAMQIVEVPTAAQAKASTPADEAPAPYVTNTALGTGGRDVLLVVDDEGIRANRTQRVSEMLTALVDALSPADRLSWIMPGNEGARVQLTTRHDAVRAAIKGLAGRVNPTEADADKLCRSRRNLYSLLAVFQNVSPSIPSVVVFVSDGFSSPTVVESVSRRAQGPTGPCEILPQDLDDLAKAATASRAQVYGIEAVDEVGALATDASDFSGGFEHIAGLSGNGVIRLAGNDLTAVRRIASETSAYYVAAFEAAPDEVDGSTQRVEVAVNRPGATVRAWPTVTMPKIASRAAKGSSAKVRDALSVSHVYREVGLRASVHIWRASSDGKAVVRCVFEPLDPETPLAEAGLAMFDDKGAAKTQWSAQKDALKEFPIVATVNLPQPGTYRLRLAAKDTWGAFGTIDQDVKIETPNKGVVSLGVLVLGKEGKTGFVPMLQFTSEPLAVGAVEIYGAPKAAAVSVAFEFAASETGPALARLTGTVQSIRDDLRIASMRFPIKQMPPGDVVVRAIVSVDGKPLDTKPVHTLRKVAK